MSHATPHRPWLDDGDAQLYHGDALFVLAALPDGVAQTCVTSPPYWGLRDYGTGSWEGGDTECDHLGPPFRTKSKINANCGTGSDVKNRSDREPMGAVCSKCGARRVDQQVGLEPSPAEYVERLVAVFREVRRVLRDDGTLWLNLGDSYNGQAPNRSGQHGYDDGRTNRSSRFSVGGVAGLKPKDLVGIPWKVAFALQADGWYLRSDIIWSKPNPMPESVSDRPTKAHEYLFLLAKQPRYYWDADAIREPLKPGADHDRHVNGHIGPNSSKAIGIGDTHLMQSNPAGRNRRSVWTVATQPFPEAHFATFPEALVAPCIQAGSRECDTVLDPFIGSGTTALVARKHGRRCIGIDLSESYLEIAARRTQQLSLLAEEAAS